MCHVHVLLSCLNFTQYQTRLSTDQQWLVYCNHIRPIRMACYHNPNDFSPEWQAHLLSQCSGWYPGRWGGYWNGWSAFSDRVGCRRGWCSDVVCGRGRSWWSPAPSVSPPLTQPSPVPETHTLSNLMHWGFYKKLPGLKPVSLCHEWGIIIALFDLDESFPGDFLVMRKFPPSLCMRAPTPEANMTSVHLSISIKL